MTDSVRDAVTPEKPEASHRNGPAHDGGRIGFSILVVDDELGICSFLHRALNKTYSQVEIATSAEQAEQLRAQSHFDLLIVDICLPGMNGVDWIKSVRETASPSDVVFMTGFADLDKAIDALRLGASDFILKPFRLEQMVSTVRRCVENRRLRRENFVLHRRINNFYSVDGMVGQSQAYRELCRIISRIARSPSAVLIEGETGTGKELVANAIHRESGRNGPFVPVNCGAISSELIESELFGHMKGAFTGASQTRDGLFSYAEGGTLFLDEIAEMPLPLQAKLLRALEERAIRPVGSEKEIRTDVRILAATNRNLALEKDAARFRADLYYRLNVVTLTIPPLRDRYEDIVPLAQYFSKLLAGQLGMVEIPFDQEDYRALETYHWPGNARELKNMIERCLLLGCFPRDILKRDDNRDGTGQGYPAGWSLEEVERDHIHRILLRYEGNKTRAARALGVNRKTLTRKLRGWGEVTGGD